MRCLIELMPKAQVPDDVEDLLWEFLCSLMRSGQILRDYTIVKKDHYFLAVTLPKPNALDEQYDNPYVRRSRSRLREIFDFRKIDLGESIQASAYCDCWSRTAVELVTCRNDIDSPLLCCGCGKPVALFEVPAPDGQDDHCELLHWQDSYSAMDLLWMRSLCDRYAGAQLMKPDSALNRQGLGMAQGLVRRLGIPVYYRMFDDGGRRVRREQSGGCLCRLCPGCGNAMRRVRFSQEVELEVCDTCGLSSEPAVE